MCSENKKYKCNLELAREQNCHPWEIYFGVNSEESLVIRNISDLPIYEYERYATYIRSGLSIEDVIKLRLHENPQIH